MKMPYQAKRRIWIIGGVLGICFLLIAGLAYRWYQAYQYQQPNAIIAQVYKEGMYAEHLPVLHFSERVFDFGKIATGELVEHTYEFTNTGDRPLIIHKVIGGRSGCVTAVWPQHPIQVGEKGQIKVMFNSAGQTGQQAQVIIIKANTDPPEVRLLLKGFIETP